MIKTLLKQIVEECICDIQKNETKERLLNPIINYILDKIYPYLLFGFVIVLLLISLLIVILITIINK